MISRLSRIPFLALLLLAVAAPIMAQVSTDAKMPHARVALYRVAPGRQLDFLKWAAEGDAMEKEAGLPVSVLYAHTDGDAWDYMQVSPVLTPEQQAKVDEVSKKHGRKTGFPANLEFRTYISWHTDTMTLGPVSAADLVAAAAK